MRLNSTAIATMLAIGVIALAVVAKPEAPQAQSASTAQTAQTAAVQTSDGAGTAVLPKPQWAASATGRVEPKNGQVVVSTTVPGRVVDVAVVANQVVKAGDLLARLDEDDLLTRVAAAAVEAQVRERERDEEVVKGLALERRQAEDSVASGERALYRARLVFDDLAFRARNGGAVPAGDVDQARFQINAAKVQLANSRANLLRVNAKDGMPLATRLESSLATARAELSLAESAVERARIRAPIDGTVLGVYVKYGELATPAPEAPLFLVGDLSSLRVKAEVEERDAPKVKVGQRVVVKGDAFPDREFEGVVTSVSQSLAAPRIQPRGVRRPTDVEVIEVIASLEGMTPLLSGMRVDVFFRAAPTAALQPAASSAAVAVPATGTAGVARATP